MKTYLILYLSFFYSFYCIGQQNVGIGTVMPNNSAQLDIVSTNKGLLIPRMLSSERSVIVSPATGLIVFQTDTPIGLYINTGTPSLPIWEHIATSATSWRLNGNSGTTPGTSFIGTTDEKPLMFKINALKAGYIDSGSPYNTSFGMQSLNSNTGSFNSAFGGQALYSNMTGGLNTANGRSALFSNTTGNNNSALGYNALYFNSSGGNNTASGYRALYSNVAGSNITAIGYQAMRNANNSETPFASLNVAVGYEALRGSGIAENNTGYNNTAIGSNTLWSNTSGYANTAEGTYALYSNSTGYNNTAIGFEVLYENTTGKNNTAIGYWALYNNTEGENNTACGSGALGHNIAGFNGTAIGYNAMRYANSSTTPFPITNVAVGYEAIKGSVISVENVGTDNTAVGYQALTNNKSGYENLACGTYALATNWGGDDNTAVGNESLFSNEAGDNNSAIGSKALFLNSDGNNNTAIGTNALYQNSFGNDNTGIGTTALYWNDQGDENIAIGDRAGFGSSTAIFNNCTFLGANTYPTVSRTNVTMLGSGIANAQCTGSNQVCLGNTAITSIRAEVTGITAYSDARFKSNVQENIPGLSFISKLKPVTYNQDPTVLHQIWGTPDSLVSNIDHSEIKEKRFIGFLAQDVEQAAKDSGFEFPGIDVPTNDTEVYSLRYVDFIMPLVKGMQEQQAIIDKLTSINEDLIKRIEALENLTNATQQTR